MSSLSDATTDWLAAIGAVRVPMIEEAPLSPALVSAGLAEVARLRGELAAVQARLIATHAAEAGRDTIASVGRQLGLSSSEAREAVDAAAVLADHHKAALELASGALQPGHLAAVRRVESSADQAALLALATSQSVDDFRNTVRQFRITQAGPDWGRRQKAARSVTFFKADNDCVGMRAVLPSIDGARLRERLRAIVHAAYRAEHPERAETLGGHRVDRVDQRMADALIALVDGDGVDAGACGRAAVVVVVDPERCEAEIIGQGPVAFDDAVALAADEARAEVYGIMQDTNGAILKFGRNRRFASALQRLAIAVRDRTCVVAGCGRSAVECDAHHEPPFEDGGRTDVDKMEARCSLHHHHRHETGETGPRRSARRPPGRRGRRRAQARSPDLAPPAPT